MTFSFSRSTQELTLRPVRLTQRDTVAPNYVRVRLEGESLSTFDSPGPADHVRLFFPGAETLPESRDAWRNLTSREYTPLAWSPEGRWLDVEFLVHGDVGVAGLWASNAEIGSQAAVGGPRGSQVLQGIPDYWLLAGDETAVPAIRRWLDVAGEDAQGRVAIEVASAAHRIPLEAGAGVDVQYVYRDGAPAGLALSDWVDQRAQEPAPDGGIFCFVAAESKIVRMGRKLLTSWGIDPEVAIIKGYWKSGTDEYHAPH